MEPEDQRDLVRRGYDTISRAYRADDGTSNTARAAGVSRYSEWINELAEVLEPSARVLDLGCGAGVPATQLLVQKGFEVVGIDFSHVQIERARQLVPGATFIEADLAKWDGEPDSFDGIVCLYTLIHVPLRDQRDLFPRIRRWLRINGIFLAIVGHHEWKGVEDYLGAPMFWEHADAATYIHWLEGAKLQLIWQRFVPEGNSGHDLVFARAV